MTQKHTKMIVSIAQADNNCIDPGLDDISLLSYWKVIVELRRKLLSIHKKITQNARVKSFMRDFCQANRTHASIGGK